MSLRSIVKSVSSFEKKPGMRMAASAVAVLFCASVSASAQAAQPSTNAASHVEIWTRAAIEGQFAGIAGTAKTKGSADAVLGSYDGHALRLSSRDASGQVEVHNHFVDVIFVVKGQATLLSGGAVIDGKPGADGEIRGTSMRGGTKRTISAGDLVHIPAGIPHQMLLQPGSTFEAEIIKVRVPGK